MNGERAYLQVKSGNETLNMDCYNDLSKEGRMFLFSSSYKGKSHENIVCLQKDVIKNFIYENKDIMPGRIKNWIEFLSNC